MRKFFCMCEKRIVGIVEAIDGDIAWALAQLAQPQVTCLKEVK